jgi:hypothetical protein
VGLCGSNFLDVEFLNYMETLIGKDKFARLPTATHDQLMDVWEYRIKRQHYHGRPAIAITVPYLVAKAINSPYKVFREGNKDLTGSTMRFKPYVAISYDVINIVLICMNREVIKSIFDPVMSEVLELVFKQRSAIMRKCQRKPKAILLVGGLGGNQFLYEKLQAETSGDMDIIQPRGPNV